MTKWLNYRTLCDFYRLTQDIIIVQIRLSSAVNAALGHCSEVTMTHEEEKVTDPSVSVTKTKTQLHPDLIIVSLWHCVGSF